MERKVTTPEDLNLFNQIVEETWREKGYEVEHATLESDCFLIYSDEGTPVGTIEFKAVTPMSEIMNYFPFLMPRSVVELDKISILKDHRSPENLVKIFQILIQYCIDNKVEKFIGLIEPAFFTFIKTHMQVPIEAVAKPFLYKGDNVVPAIASMSALIAQAQANQK